MSTFRLLRPQSGPVAFHPERLSPEIPFRRHSETGSEAQDRRRGAQCSDQGNERWQLKGSPCCGCAKPIPKRTCEYYGSDPGSDATPSNFEF